MLTSFRVRAFKSLGDVELHLRDLTLLIGWNASGKSNVIEALSLLCWAARAQRLTDLPHAMKTGQVRIRGNVSDLAPIGRPEGAIHLGCRIDPPEHEAPFTAPRVAKHTLGPLDLSLDVRVSSRDVRVERETLRAPAIENLNFHTPLYDATAAAPTSHVLDVAFQSFKRGTNPSVACVPDQPCFAQLTTPAHFPSRYAATREVLPLAARRVGDVLGAVRFLDPDPRAMRGYAFRDDPELHENGGNVSAVLRHLVDAGRTDEVLAFVADLPERTLRGISFVDTPRNEVMVVLQEVVGGEVAEIPAALLSDGTLRVLAVGAALLSAPAGSLVVVEEIDNGVHPSRAGSLLASIHRTAVARGLRVLLTTHNPAMQDALPEAVLPDVTLAWRDPTDGQTRLSRLADLEAFPRMVAAGALGQLVTRKSFEAMVKEPAPKVDLDWFFGAVAEGRDE